jgi:hypothetical protein
VFGGVHAFSNELKWHFPSQELMNALGVVYPHYWVVANFGALFPLHLEVIMLFYYVP